jgi:hypothetical protein
MNTIHVKRQVVVVGLTILTMAIGILSITGSDINQAAYAASSHYQIGYNDACNGVVVDNHLHQLTSDYLDGYAAGAAACHGNGNGGTSGSTSNGMSQSSNLNP